MERLATSGADGAAREAILVVKLGAFGNIILSFGAFAAIRAHHPTARITALTTAPYAKLLAGLPWFDDVIIDSRPAWWDLAGILRLRRALRAPGFRRVYDLQTSSRSSHYFRLFWPRPPEWSGIARGCSHPDRNPDRDRIHDIDRQAAQLRQAGIAAMPPPDLAWCGTDISPFALPHDIALLVPGSSPHRPQKRWPVACYRALAQALADRGITPVVLGGALERDLAAAIPAAIDLTNRTDLGALAELGRTARLTVGNDTGPMHLLAAVGCPSVVLFSADSDPALCAPRGAAVTVLQRRDLATLSVDDVLAALPVAALERA